jgi:hypothetical protein
VGDRILDIAARHEQTGRLLRVFEPGLDAGQQKISKQFIVAT